MRSTTKVYKYRGGDSNFMRDLASLRDNQFYAPTPEVLNDPTEACVDYDELRATISVLDGRLLAAFDNAVDIRHSSGIYSLSRTPLDECMWAYYGDSHRGFCIEYDLARLVREARAAWSVVDVDYSPEPPNLLMSHIADPRSEEVWLQLLNGTKSDSWAHEREVRIVTAPSGLQNYASVAVTGVYFGCRCPSDRVEAVRRTLSGRGVTYHQLSFLPKRYRLSAETIPYNAEVDGVVSTHRAKVDAHAIPSIETLEPKLRQYHPLLFEAVETARADPSCEEVQIVDFKRGEKLGSKPQIWVQYRTNVPTPYVPVVNAYYDLEEFL